MELVKLTEFLIKNITKEPDLVSVKQFDDEDNTIVIQVMVASDDMATVIGSHGKTANAIRTIVQASSYINENKRVKVNIDSF